MHGKKTTLCVREFNKWEAEAGTRCTSTNFRLHIQTPSCFTFHKPFVAQVYIFAALQIY